MQVGFVAARFNLYNRQVFKQSAGIEKLNAFVKNLNSRIIGTAIVLMDALLFPVITMDFRFL